MPYEQIYNVRRQILSNKRNFRSYHCYFYKNLITYGQAIPMKRICSNEEKLSSQDWGCKRDHKKEMVHNEIQKVQSMNTEYNCSGNVRKRIKVIVITLVLTYYSALNRVHEVRKKAHRHTIR